MTDDLQPPTPLEASARAMGADTRRYRIEYLMLPMRDGARLATVVIRPQAAGAYPVLLVRTPYRATSLDAFDGLAKHLFEKDYAVIIQNERGSQWSEGDFGLLAKATADGQDTLDWIARPGIGDIPGAEGSQGLFYRGGVPTGGRNDRETDGPVAHLTVHHGGDHPSRIRLREYLGPVTPNPVPPDSKVPA